MKRKASYSALLTMAVVAFVGLALGTHASANGTIDVDVQVSPHTIVLGLDKGSAITVHTDIAYSAVDGASVALSGVAATSTFADSCGNLVGKFSQASIEAIVAPPSATLVLIGMTKDGMAFSGSDTVRVIDDPSPGK